MNDFENEIFVPGDQRAVVGAVGGKAFNLDCLVRAGFPVPVWFALTAECFVQVMKAAGLMAVLDHKLSVLSAEMTPDEIDLLMAEVRQKIQSVPIPVDLSEKLENQLKSVIGDGFFSVRSSGIDEDAAGASFAGMHDSLMYVRGLNGLLDAVRQVWCSLFNTRALMYRLKNGLPLKDLKIGVIVQQMVDASVSGVMFTANPNSGNVKEVVISSLFGAGEGLVSAGLEADVFTVHKFTGEIDETIAEKEFEMVSAEAGGLKQVALAEDKRSVASLNADQLAELSTLGQQVEQFYGRAQDVEFSLDQSAQIFLLQARPVTTVSEYGPAAGNRMIWDNSNIVESYSGPTSPMTFSFIRRAYTIVYHCFSEVMGIDPKVVKANQAVYENMLGLLHGQVYYNIYNWYELVKQFPGFNYNKSFMESMMGVREKMADETGEKTGFWQKCGVELPKLLKLVMRSGRNFRKIDRLVDEFDRHFRSYYDRWESLDMSEMQPHELMKLYREMETALLWNWKTPIINDFYVMIYYGVLKKLCSKWCGDEHGSLQNDLICGEGDIESTRPTRMLMELAGEIKANPERRQLFEEKSVPELLDLVKTLPDLTDIREKVAFYLKEYGFRCINELKLEEPSLREMPDFVYQMIKNYLKMEDAAIDPAEMDKRETAIRDGAEKRALEKLGPIKRKIFKRVLRNARKGVKNRENMRFARTRIYGKVREMLNEIGRYCEREAILDNWTDIYYLTMDEVWDYIKGTAVTTNLKGLAALRKKEFDFYNSEEAPEISDRFETFGPVYHRNLFKNYQQATNDGDGLCGIGCSPGVVTAKVRVLKSPQDGAELNGEILVAGRTDPGWVPLYPAVSGILIERGSILSHSAIVAREMGIPTIVGIPELMKTLEDGQTVTMDGSAGTLTVD